MRRLDIPAERFNAIKLPNGALGCSMSHLKCLEMAKAAGWPHLLIVEDDIKFLDLQLFNVYRTENNYMFLSILFFTTFVIQKINAIKSYMSPWVDSWSDRG